MKIKNILLIIALLLLTGTIVYLFLNKDTIKFHAGIGDYQIAWNTNTVPVTFIDDSGRSHSKVNVIEVPKGNLTDVKQLEDLTDEVKGLRKNLTNLENYITISSQTIIHKTTYLRDTVYFTSDSVLHHTKTFSQEDKFDTLRVVIKGDSAEWYRSHTDSLASALYWDRKWFLGRKKYKNEIINFNPMSKIIYQSVVKAARKRGLFK